MTDTASARFEARWGNGYWLLFDTERYCPIDTFRLRAHAEEAAWAANTNPTGLESTR